MKANGVRRMAFETPTCIRSLVLLLEHEVSSFLSVQPNIVY